MTAHLALLFTQLCFASMGVAMKLALRDVSPMGLIAFRVPAAFAVIAAAALVLRPQPIPRKDWPAFGGLAILGIVANQLLFAVGLQYTTATHAVLIGASIPVFTTAIAALVGRERFHWRAGAGIACGVVGTALIVGRAESAQGSFRLLGDALIVANSLFYSVYLVVGRPVLQRYPALSGMTLIFAFGALGVLPFGLPALWNAWPSLPPRFFAAAGYIVIFPTVASYFLSIFALRRLSSSVVAQYIYLQPPVGALLAAAWLGERPSPLTLVGGGIIALGVWFATSRQVVP